LLSIIKIYQTESFNTSLHTKNTEFQNLRIEVQVLNTTAIASSYVGRDPQGGTNDGSFL